MPDMKFTICPDCGRQQDVRDLDLCECKTKYWPCKHIHKQKNGPWLYNSTSSVLHSWIHCPDCEAKRPEEPIALWEEIQRAGAYNQESFPRHLAEAAIKWFEGRLPFPETMASEGLLKHAGKLEYRLDILQVLGKEKEKCK